MFAQNEKDIWTHDLGGPDPTRALREEQANKFIDQSVLLKSSVVLDLWWSSCHIYSTITFSIRMEMEAVTAVLRWLSDPTFNKAVIITDSVNALEDLIWILLA